MKKTVAVLGVAVSLLLLIAPAAQASASAWKVMRTPVNAGAQQGVSCWAKTGCLSVGNGQAMKWNGRKWTAVSEPADSFVIGVSCRSATYCIGVGNVNGVGAAAWLWDGTTWTGQSVYSPSGFPGAALSAVDCTSRMSCEAVGSTGYEGCTGECGPLAEIWNGVKWVDQSIPGAPENGWLDGVACQRAVGICEAVGGAPAYTCTSVCVVPPVAWAAGLSKATWVMQPSMAGLYPQASIADNVSCWSSGCIAVGREGSAIGPSNPAYTFAALWNGSSWSPKGVTGSGEPSGAYFAYWSGVHCWSASRCTAVGGYEPVYNSPYVTLASTWNGSKWSQVVAPGRSGSDLSGLFCTNQGFNCVAVGSQSSAALAMRN